MVPLRYISSVITSERRSSEYCLNMISKRVLGFLLICAIIVAATSQKPGKCPPVRPDEVGPCAILCRSDSECNGNQKCCRNGCGGSQCTSPI